MTTDIVVVNARSFVSFSSGCLLIPLLTPASRPVSLLKWISAIYLSCNLSKGLVEFYCNLCFLELVRMSTGELGRYNKVELVTRKQRRQTAREIALKLSGSVQLSAMKIGMDNEFELLQGSTVKALDIVAHRDSSLFARPLTVLTI